MRIIKKLTSLKSYQLIYIGISISVALLLLCIVIDPASLGDNNGFSYFGAKAKTIAPYSLAFLSYAFFMWLASNKLIDKNRSSKVLRAVLIIMALLMVGLTVTPHTILVNIHKLFGSSLFVIQLLTSFYLVVRNGKNYLVYLLILLMLTSGLFSWYYLFLNDGYMIQSQLVYQVAFAGILISYLKNIKKCI
jgi:hypothetical protein